MPNHQLCQSGCGAEGDCRLAPSGQTLSVPGRMGRSGRGYAQPGTLSSVLQQPESQAFSAPPPPSDLHVGAQGWKSPLRLVPLWSHTWAWQTPASAPAADVMPICGCALLGERGPGSGQVWLRGAGKACGAWAVVPPGNRKTGSLPLYLQLLQSDTSVRSRDCHQIGQPESVKRLVGVEGQTAARKASAGGQEWALSSFLDPAGIGWDSDLGTGWPHPSRAPSRH